MSTVEHAVALAGELVALRRALHRHPEIGLRLPRTKAIVLEALRGLPVEVHEGESLDSVVGVIRGTKGSGGPVVLLRGDMDALPVQEEVDAPAATTFTSRPSSARPGSSAAGGRSWRATSC